MTQQSIFIVGKEAETKPVHPFSELRDLGLLWLINRVVFHPRGYALALVPNEDGTEAIGWRMYGDGGEPVAFDPADEDAPFNSVEDFLHSLRPNANVVIHVEDDDEADGLVECEVCHETLSQERAVETETGYRHHFC